MYHYDYLKKMVQIRSLYIAFSLIWIRTLSFLYEEAKKLEKFMIKRTL